MKKATKSDITLFKRICTNLRTAVVDLQQEYRQWDPDLCGACAVASSAMIKIMHDLFFTDAQLVCIQGEFGGHCWVSLPIDGEDYALDITATQFGGPKIVISPRERYLQKPFASQFKPIDEILEGSAAEALVETWPDEQRPSSWSSIVVDQYDDVVNCNVIPNSLIVLYDKLKRTA